jgi:hypothetical protein
MKPKADNAKPLTKSNAMHKHIATALNKSDVNAPSLRRPVARPGCLAMTFENLRSPERQLIELRMEHADLNASIDRLSQVVPENEMLLRRLKKRRLVLRDQVHQLERDLEPKEPA